MELEHVNLTVRDPDAHAAMLSEVFGWHVRWRGDALGDGIAVHVGTDDTYVALATRPEVGDSRHEYPWDRPGLAHVGVLVDDLDACHDRVVAAGLETFNQNAVAPGRRFYFFDTDGICWEAASYTS